MFLCGIPAISVSMRTMSFAVQLTRRTMGGRRRVRLRAAAGLAVDFRTWHSLIRRRATDDQTVIELVGLVRQAAA